MKKALATTAIATAIALSLSGCTFGLLGPATQPESDPAPAPAPQSSSEQEPTTDANDGGYTDELVCEDGESFNLTNDNYDGGSVYVSGDCGDITVSASNVTVSIESVDRLAITGLYNTIVVSGELDNVSVPGDMNTISGVGVGDVLVDGYSNVVSFESASSVTVNGDENSIAWYSGAASGTDAGTDNYLSAP